MKILAIDTSSEICSVAILENDKLIDKNEQCNGKTHSENLMPLLDELLRRNNLDISEMELFACTVGPGSFTGIRIGVSTIKPMAEILNKKVASVTSLEVLANNVEKEKLNLSENSTIVSLIDARNNQVYAGIFDKNYNLKMDYIAEDINFVLDKIKEFSNFYFVGDGSVLHRELISSNFENAVFLENNSQSAENVGKIAFKKYLENNLCTADTLVPVYLRKSQAERLKK